MPLFPQTPREHAGYIAGMFYPLGRFTANAAAVAAIDVIYFYPFILPANMAFTGAAIRVGTGGAGSSCKGGIYADSPVSHRPLGAPLFVDNTGVATTASNANAALAIGSGSLSAGVPYWYGTKYTGTLPSVTAAAATIEDTAWFAGIPNSGSLAALGVNYADTYSNNMPTISEGSVTLANSAVVIPLLFMKT